MTLKEVYEIIRVNNDMRKEEAQAKEFYAWLHGAYIEQAIAATVGNYFCQPKERFEYPENPILHANETEEERIQRELDKMIAAEEAFIAVHKSHGLKVQTIDKE